MAILELAREAKEASIKMASLDGDIKNKALGAIAEALHKRAGDIIEANRIDVDRSEKENLPSPIIKRLKFDQKKIEDVIKGIESLIKLEEPVGKTMMTTQLDDGLELRKVSCPIGVIGVVFESRPDALVQISTLCLKSGNAVLLKGGSEASNTNSILWSIISQAADAAGIPSGWIQLLETRDDVNEMLKMDQYVDLIIPRGSNSFVRYIMDNSRIPVMGHADGVCHCYVDKDADIDMAVRIVVDSKTQYVAVCNALETLLVHEKAAQVFLPELKKEMDKRGVVLLGCPVTQQITGSGPAGEDDWSREYLDYKLVVRVVSDIQEAIDHINRYGSGHTDTIVTSNKENATLFMGLVDSGNVFWNCSTRFSDGFRYGFGAEVGISTSKLHARGPVGLDGLLIYKYLLYGNGHIVDDYARGIRSFKHIRK